MDRELQELVALGAIEGAFVCSSTGDVVVCSSPPVLATAGMTQMGRALVQAFGAFDAAGTPVDHFDLTFDSWTLFTRDLGQGLIVVICDPNVDLAMLRMSVDIAITSWTRSGQLQKRLGTGKSTARLDLLSRANLDETAWRSLRLLTGNHTA